MYQLRVEFKERVHGFVKFLGALGCPCKLYRVEGYVEMLEAHGTLQLVENFDHLIELQRAIAEVQVYQHHICVQILC